MQNNNFYAIGRLSFILLVVILLSGCKLWQDSVEESITKAKKQLENGERRKAIERLQSIITQQHVPAEAFEILAFAFAEEGEAQQAAYYFSELGSKSAEYQHYFLYAAQNWELGNNLEDAAACYRKYLEKEETAFSVWTSLGKIYETLQQFNLALEAYHKSFHLKPDSYSALRLGILYEQLNNDAQAESWLKRTIELGSKEQKGEALLRLLPLSVRQKQFAVAEELITQIEEGFPEATQDTVFSTLSDQIKHWREKQDLLKEELKALQMITDALNENKKPE